MEQDIQSKIIGYLNSQGFYTIKVVRASKRGVPDICSCVHGLFVVFEVKDKNGLVAPLQQANIDKVIKSKGFAYSVRSLSEVKSIINKLNFTYGKSSQNA